MEPKFFASCCPIITDLIERSVNFLKTPYTFTAPRGFFATRTRGVARDPASKLEGLTEKLAFAAGRDPLFIRAWTRMLIVLFNEHLGTHGLQPAQVRLAI